MRRKTKLLKRSSTLLLLLQLFFASNVHAQLVPTLSFDPVITGLTIPVDVANAGDGTNRLFIVQQGGIIKVYSQAYAYLGDFLTVTGISFNFDERGLLSLHSIQTMKLTASFTCGTQLHSIRALREIPMTM